MKGCEVTNVNQILHIWSGWDAAIYCKKMLIRLCEATAVNKMILSGCEVDNVIEILLILILI